MLEKFDEFNADSLMQLLQNAERFNQYSQLKNKNDMVYRIVYDHWMNFIVAKLNEAYDKKYSIKYNAKFRYLLNRCEEQRYMSRIGNSSYEKALFYLIEGRYAYLWNRFWIGTTGVFKAVFFLLGLSVLYGYYAIFRLHFKRKQ